MRPAYLITFCLVALALCVGGGFVWNKVLWRMGWFNEVPPLAKGMFAQPGNYSPSWSRRLTQAFPVGSPVQQLTDTLKRQGFDVDTERQRAAYGWAVYPCVYTLTVLWRADGSRRVRFVQGGLLNACTDPSKLIPERPSRGRGRGADNPQRNLVPDSQSA